ncbi:MAG: hypothetical protein ACYCY0_07910 [Acidithiobacillus ferrivorans]
MVQTHGIQAFKDVTVLAMQRGATVGLMEAQDVLETRDDAFLARGSAGRLERGNFYPQRIQQFVMGSSQKTENKAR